MVSTGTQLSVADFARLPQPTGGIRQELHHGELIELPPVKKRHTKLQKRIVSLIEPLLNGTGLAADKEFPFRPKPEFEVWVADVAIYSNTQWEHTPDDDYFRGVPTIVIEVLSPSNTASEMLDREDTCLRNGGKEFWLVDPQREFVKVVRSDGSSAVYGATDTIVSGIVTVAVREIFAR